MAFHPFILFCLAVQFRETVSYFAYRNNDLHFSTPVELGHVDPTSGARVTLNRINRITFQIQNYSVTPGQDPDGHVYTGKILNDTSKLRLVVGRSMNRKNEEFIKKIISFPEQISESRNVQHTNFAIFGTLNITFENTWLTGHKTVTLENILFSQFAEGSQNRYTVGGLNCNNVAFGKVLCCGRDEQNLQVFLRFDLGKSDMLAIVDYQTFDYDDWMTYIEDSKTLSEIIMPGSHDAGMYMTKNCDQLSTVVDATRLKNVNSFVRTQHLNMRGQLLAGARYFDIRPMLSADESLVTYHKAGVFGCEGDSLENILSQTIDFLNEHGTEMVILKFSHVSDKVSAEATLRFLTEDEETHSKLYKSDNSSTVLSKVPLSELRGKIAVVFTYEWMTHLDTSKGFFRYMENLVVYDKYSNTNNLYGMMEDQLEKWFNFGHKSNKKDEQLFLLSWTLTLGVTSIATESIQENAVKANAVLPGILRGWIQRMGRDIPNIVYVDYINRELAQSITYFNLDKKTMPKKHA